MAELTTDPNDPRIKRGSHDDEPTPQHEVERRAHNAARTRRRYALVVEAIHSTAMSHHGGCRCDVCLAAGGDKAALERIFVDGANDRLARELLALALSALAAHPGALS